MNNNTTLNFLLLNSLLLIIVSVTLLLSACGDATDRAATPSDRCLDQCEEVLETRDAQTCVVTECGTLPLEGVQ